MIIRAPTRFCPKKVNASFSLFKKEFNWKARTFFTSAPLYFVIFLIIKSVKNANTTRQKKLDTDKLTIIQTSGMLISLFSGGGGENRTLFQLIASFVLYSL